MGARGGLRDSTYDCSVKSETVSNDPQRLGAEHAERDSPQAVLHRRAGPPLP